MSSLEIEQRSDDWFAIRCGRVTASRIADLMARTKSGPAASRENYKAQLVCERLTGCVESSFTNTAMQWGVDKEGEARAAYTFMQDSEVREVGFVIHPTIEMSGASPDGLIGGEGMLEIKCPSSSTHIGTLLGKSIPSKYIYQLTWQMACTGRAWCDFASYDPRLPESMRLIVIRLHRDDAMIAEIEREVTTFLAEIDETVSRLRAAYEPEAVAA